MEPARAVAAPPRAAALETRPARAAQPATARLVERLSPYGWRLLGITVVGLLGRVLFLDHQPLWRDEGFTELASRRSWLDMLDVVRHDSAPPLAYMLTHITTAVSTSPWWLRLPAALAGTAAIPLGAALGRRIGGDRCGLCAAGVIALGPAYVLSARDARMYALAGTMTLAVVLSLWRAVEAPDRRRLALLALSVAGALLTQYLTALAIVAACAAALVALQPARRALLRSLGAIALGTVPLLAWLPFAAPQLQHATQPFWVLPIGGASLLGVLTEFFCGPAVDQGIPHRDLLQTMQAGAIMLGGVAGLMVILHTLFLATSRQRRAVSYVAGASFGGLALLLGISLFHPLLDARYASVLWPPLTVLLGVGLGVIRPRRLASVPLGAMAAAAGLLCIVPLRSDVVPLVTRIGHPGPHAVVLAHRAVYLQVLVAAPPDVAAITHIPEASIEWYWGVAAFPPGALMPRVPDDVDRIYEVAESGAGKAGAIPVGFVAVSQECAVDACLTVWQR